MSSEDEEQKQRNREYYNRAMDELSKRELSTQESLDRAIVFTSLPILGLAIAFFRSNGTPVSSEWLFYMSAVAFLFAIFFVIFSYWTALFAKNELEKQLKKYAFEKSEKPYSKWNRATEWLNRSSTILYFFGVIVMAIFFYCNFPKQGGNCG